MKIGIPLTTSAVAIEAQLAPSFHHTSLLGIYDMVNSILETIDLKENNNSGGFVELLKQHEIKAVISAEYTVMALKLFKVMNIETFKAEDAFLSINLQSFKNGELLPYTFRDAMEASSESCDSSCTSCHTTCK